MADAKKFYHYIVNTLQKFIDAYNLTAKPFIWKKREIKGAQLANNVRNFCN
jgi:hypothetical protein